MESRVAAICGKFANDKSRLLDILLEVQRELRCVDSSAMDVIAREVGSYRVEVEGMVTFYAFLSETKQGEVVIRLCDDIIDEMAGAGQVAAAVGI